MVEINPAYEEGDLSTLEMIDLLGPLYIATKMAEQTRDQHSIPVASDVPSTQNRKHHTDWAEILHSTIRMLHPYAFLRTCENWNGFGRWQRLFSLCVSCAWTFGFYKAWIGLGFVSATLVKMGYPHESLPGLIVVLLYGLLIIVALQCVVPVAAAGLCLALILGAAYLMTAIGSALLACFHPMLAYVAPAIVIPMVLLWAWNALGEE